MSADRTDKRAQRVARLRAYRERHAAAVDARQRRINLMLIAVFFLFGFFMTLSSILYFSPWGIVGGVMVLGGGAALIQSERSRVVVLSREDKPRLKAEFLWLIAAIVGFFGGMVVTMHPW